MRERPALFLGLLADQPELIAEVGVLRWRAAGSRGTPGPWIEATAGDARGAGLPLTLVAMDLEGHAIGAVTLECREQAAWVVGMVVRPGERRCGVGRLLVEALEDLARDHGHDVLQVYAEEADLDFYRRCGWLAEETPSAPGVLSKPLAGG